MDHSIREYLNKRTTEELEAILAYCLKEENYKNYEYAIIEILGILEQRYVPTKLSPHIIQAWEKLQQDFANRTEDGYLS